VILLKRLKPKIFKPAKRVKKKDTNLISKVPISGVIASGIEREPSGRKDYRKMLENKI